MTTDNDIVERLRALSRCEHSDLSVGDEAAAEIVRLRGEVDAMETCAVKYLGWLGVKDATAALRKDMADPEMLGHAIAPAEAFDPSIHPIPGEGQQPAACDMGELCIGCEPRNADGSCPDQQPAACRCVDCGGDQPGHDPHCANMREIHGTQPQEADRG